LCCSALQFVAADCCTVLPFDAVCYSVLQVMVIQIYPFVLEIRRKFLSAAVRTVVLYTTQFIQQTTISFCLSVSVSVSDSVSVSLAVVVIEQTTCFH